MAVVTELHPEAEVRRQRRNRAVLISNLKNTGLNMPGVEIAYRAALLAGATDEMAWEAARRHELILIGFPDEIEERGGPGFPRAMDNVTVARARRQALIDTCRALPNPFAPAVAMERAA